MTAPSVAAQRDAIQKTAASVGFIDSQQYKDRYANNLVDVLQDAPGVYVQPRYSQELRLSIRGSGISRGFHTRGIEILQDGIPTNLADGSGDYYQIDPLAIRSIGIYKGGNALIFGSSTLGGAIDFVSPTGRTALSQNSISFEGGSFQTLRANAQFARAGANWDFFVSGTLTHADGDRSHDNQEGEHFNANIGYRFSDRVETRFYFGAYYTDQLLPGALQSGLKASDAPFSYVLNNRNLAAATALRYGTARDTYVERLANRTTVALDFGKIDVDSWLIHKRLYHPTSSSFNDQDGVTYGVAPRFSAAFNLAGFHNETTIGARLYAGTNNAKQNNYADPLGNYQLPYGNLYLNSRQKSANYEAFAENHFYLRPELALVAGVKAVAQERDFVNLGGLIPNPAYQDLSKTFKAVNPKLGVLWEPKKDIQFFADITRSSDVPDFTDLTQGTAGSLAPEAKLTSFTKGTGVLAPIRQQHAWTAEIGTRGKYERLSWDVTFYRSSLRDELLSFTVTPTVPVATFNAPKTIHQGIEFGAGFDIARDLTEVTRGDLLTFNLLWNHSDFRFQNDPVYRNNQIPGIPVDYFRASLTYKHPSGFYVTPNIEYVPQGAYADYSNTQKVPGYALLGVKTGWNFANGVSVYLDARNLTDKRYISDFSPSTKYDFTKTFYTGAGRSVFAGVRYQW